MVKNFEKLSYLTEDASLKENSQYMYQVIVYCGIYGLNQASLIIWSSVDYLIVSVKFNEELWNEILFDCNKYYYEYYLPVYFKENLI